ncbi:hypothetical protein HAT86_06855 [Roseovarius gahaiensis]|uniref:Uncharacterized protein n=1 Tax=Roseovarius gahaiensis TaxID=2716691 RepID=A0A967BCC6_9RHOB|nr:hypothetical protein [Roseovarius gahaiensis]NHQ74183.1 hypothetical protein [Roseovarius gahaiensis]
MKQIVIPLGLMLLAPALQAQDTMGAAAFEAYTQGKTFYYGAQGTAYGAEEYLSDRRVRWSFLDGDCQTGYWYEDDGLICFVYDDRPDPQCWSFVKTTNGLVARYLTQTRETELYEVEQSDEPLECKGPRIGV